jgi:hypothetical protein
MKAFGLARFKNPLFFHLAIADQLAISHTQPNQQRTNKINQKFTTIGYLNNPIRNYNQASSTQNLSKL